MALWGSSFLPIYPTIMKAWTPIVLLMSARNSLMNLGSLWAFLKHGERHEDPSGVCEGRIYLLSLLFILWAFLIPFISQCLHSPLFLLAQALKGCGQSLGVCFQICWCPQGCI